MAKDYYYLRKTIDYFKKKGYEVEKLEKTYRVYDKKRRLYLSSLRLISLISLRESKLISG